METDCTFGWCCINGDECEEEEENHNFVEGEHGEGFGGLLGFNRLHSGVFIFGRWLTETIVLK